MRAISAEESRLIRDTCSQWRQVGGGNLQSAARRKVEPYKGPGLAMVGRIFGATVYLSGSFDRGPAKMTMRVVAGERQDEDQRVLGLEIHAP